MDFFSVPEFDVLPPVPWPELKPGDVVRIELPDATYSGLVSTVVHPDPERVPDEGMNITFWTEPTLDRPAGGEGE